MREWRNKNELTETLQQNRMEVTAYLCFAVYVHRFRFQSFVICWVIQFTYICVTVVFSWPKVVRDAIVVKETLDLTKVDIVWINRCNRVTFKSLFVYFTRELNDATCFCKNHERPWSKIILAWSSRCQCDDNDTLLSSQNYKWLLFKY